MVLIGGRRDLELGGNSRAKHGCILSFENEQGQRLVLHREGAPTKIVAAICDEALALDPSFRVVSYSTPTTIYGDLTGARVYYQHKNGYDQAPMMPEKAILRRVRRLEMLHLRLALLGVDERVADLQYRARRRRKGSK